MMKFKTVINQDALQTMISAGKAIANEIRIEIEAEGLKIMAVDPANILLGQFAVPSSAFEVYEVEPGIIAIDLDKFAQFTSGKDPIAMELENQKLLIKTGKAKYTMGLLSPDSINKPPKIPTFDLPASITISGEDFAQAVASANKVSDHLVLRQDETAMHIESKGDIDDAHIEIPLTEAIRSKPGISRSMFSLNYLNDIAKVAKKSGEVSILSGLDYPAKIKFVANGVEVEYMIAPRIEQE